MFVEGIGELQIQWQKIFMTSYLVFVLVTLNGFIVLIHNFYFCFYYIEIHMHFGLLTRYPMTFLNLLINSNNLVLFLCMSYVHNPNCI